MSVPLSDLIVVRFAGRLTCRCCRTSIAVEGHQSSVYLPDTLLLAIVIRAIERAIENEDPIIVEHRMYRGASAPNRLIFEDFDTFAKWLHEDTFAGDATRVWSYEAVCTDTNDLAHGKCPDERGEVPRGGAIPVGHRLHDDLDRSEALHVVSWIDHLLWLIANAAEKDLRPSEPV